VRTSPSTTPPAERPDSPRTAPARPLVCVVGADGTVGGVLAPALGARRVVYGPVREGEVHASACGPLLRSADVVVTAHGFRIRPGCSYREYRASHEEATATLVPHLRPGALLVHVSSTSVLGTGVGLGAASPPRPEAYPSPAYGRAKLEEERFLERAARQRGFRLVFLRPATVYSAEGAGMVRTLVRLARRGVALRLYPRDARHHLVHGDLLAEVVRRVIARDDLPSPSTFVVAEPWTVTNRQLEALVRPALRRASVPVPLPVPLLAAILRRTFHSRHPALDLRTKGEIFGVLSMDTVYDPSETFRVLGIDPARWTMDRTLVAVVAEALRA
jgi:nucleoside-diphosphate-sugar epimerase